MHTRRFTALLLGLWLGASLLLDWVSMSAFTVVKPSLDSLRHREPVMMRTLGEEPVERLLRYQSAEVNRHITYVWGYVQVALGVVLLLVVLFATNGNKLMLGLSAGMLAVAAAMQFGVMPSMLENDRALDFASAPDLPRLQAAFQGSHNTFIGMEALKIAVGVILAGALLYQRADSRRRRRSIDLDPVNHPNHGRVNR